MSQSKKISTLVLVRHGQSQWNKENLFTGWKDPDLTEKGIEEAINAGKKIKQTNSQNSAGIAVFATDALAQVANPVAGTMTFSQESDKIFIYNGTAWVKTAALT
mgnify:CR=1 FL=1